jgi:hypothetical protein
MSVEICLTTIPAGTTVPFAPVSVTGLMKFNRLRTAAFSAVVEAAHDQHDRVENGIDPGQLRAAYEGERSAALRTARGAHEGHR